MVVTLGAGKTWAYRAKGPTSVPFASASSPDDAAVEVLVNDETVDYVYLHVPHSWWANTGQTFTPALSKGDRLEVRAHGGKVAVRMDLNAQE